MYVCSLMLSAPTVTPKRIPIYDSLAVYGATLVLLLMAVLFYRERVIFSDSAGYVVHIMTHNAFEISMHSRFVGALSQWLPLLAYRCNASLDTILRLYSLNSILVPVSCILVSLYWFRETRTAWSILLFYTLMNTWLFYYPVSELQMGLCLFLFYHGAANYFGGQGRINSAPFILLSLLLIPTIVFSHPLAYPILVSWLALRYFIDKKSWKQLLFPATAGTLSWLIKHFFFTIWYESDKTSQGLEHFSGQTISGILSGLSSDFLKMLAQDAFLLPLLMLAVTGILIYQRRYWAAIWFLLVLAAWWILVSVSFFDGHYDHYYEHMYQAIPFFIALYGALLLPGILKPALTRFCFLFIFALSVVKICNGQKFHEERFAWFERCFTLMDRMQCKKAAFTSGVIPGGSHCPSFWSVSYETLLLSTLKGKKEGKTIYITGNIEDARNAVNVVHDIDTMQHFPLTPPAYFDISGYRYCVPEDHYTPAQISKVMYGITNN